MRLGNSSSLFQSPDLCLVNLLLCLLLGSHLLHLFGDTLICDLGGNSFFVCLLPDLFSRLLLCLCRSLCSLLPHGSLELRDLLLAGFLLLLQFVVPRRFRGLFLTCNGSNFALDFGFALKGISKHGFRLLQLLFVGIDRRLNASKNLLLRCLDTFLGLGLLCRNFSSDSNLGFAIQFCLLKCTLCADFLLGHFGNFFLRLLGT